MESCQACLVGIDGAHALGVLDLAHAGFAARVAGVVAPAWEWSTPCTEWDVTALVDHVRSAAEIYAAIASGVPFAAAMMMDSEAVAADRLPGESDAAATRLRAILTAPGALGLTHAYPGGVLSGADLVVLRVFDVAVHTWDLARATEQSERLHPSTVTLALRYAIEHLGEDRDPGPSTTGDQPSELPLDQRRLLELAGRSP